MKLKVNRKLKNVLLFFIAMFFVSIFFNYGQSHGFLNYTACLLFIISLIVIFVISSVYSMTMDEVKSDVGKLFFHLLLEIIAYIALAYSVTIFLYLILAKHPSVYFYSSIIPLYIFTFLQVKNSLIFLFQTAMDFKHQRENKASMKALRRHHTYIEKTTGFIFSDDQYDQLEEKEINLFIGKWNREMANDFLRIVLGHSADVLTLLANGEVKSNQEEGKAHKYFADSVFKYAHKELRSTDIDKKEAKKKR